jgi:hypothetical protein
VSLTAFVIASVARAAATHPEVHAYVALFPTGELQDTDRADVSPPAVTVNGAEMPPRSRSIAVTCVPPRWLVFFAFRHFA